jgi:ATP-dependent Clp protease ATP-binding subunit ClpB
MGPKGLELRRKFALNPRHYPTLTKLGRNLTVDHKFGRLEPAIGRENEVRRVLQILKTITCPNPVLVGDAGVGKTAIAEDLPRWLPEDQILIRIRASDIVSGKKYRGEMEAVAKGIVEELAKSKGRVLLFIDELHMLVGGGASEGGMDLSNIFKPPLASGEIHCIGATTLREYRRYISKELEEDESEERPSQDPFARRFKAVVVKELSPDDTVRALESKLPGLEAKHGVKYAPGTVRYVIERAQSFVNERRPDREIKLLDDAGASAQGGTVMTHHVDLVLSEYLEAFTALHPSRKLRVVSRQQPSGSDRPN